MKPESRFRRSERLRRNAQFQRVYREGKSRAGSLLVLFHLSGPDLTRRVGVVAGRRVGNAVRRNRAKRLLREAFRHLKHRIPAEGLELVLIARKGCADATLATVVAELERLLGRAGVVEPREPSEDR